PAKFSGCGRRNGKRAGVDRSALPAFGGLGGCATSSGRTGLATVAAFKRSLLPGPAGLFFAGIAGNPTRRCPAYPWLAAMALLEFLATATPARVVAAQFSRRYRRRASPAVRAAAAGGSDGRSDSRRSGPVGRHHRRRRRDRRFRPQLDSIHVRRDVELDVVEELLEGRKRLVFVLHQRVFLAEGPQPD